MPRSKLTKLEKESIILFNEEEDIATIYTFNTKLKNRLATFAKKYPELCRLTVEDREFGSEEYEIRKSRISIRLVPPYSAERRKAASEYAKKHGIKRDREQYT